jgi:hypothetical protein
VQFHYNLETLVDQLARQAALVPPKLPILTCLESSQLFQAYVSEKWLLERPLALRSSSLRRFSFALLFSLVYHLILFSLVIFAFFRILELGVLRIRTGRQLEAHTCRDWSGDLLKEIQNDEINRKT